MAKWDDLPPELAAKILAMRGEVMMAEHQQRVVAKVVASFWEAVWRARPRVFKHKLPAASSHGQANF